MVSNQGTSQPDIIIIGEQVYDLSLLPPNLSRLLKDLAELQQGVYYMHINSHDDYYVDHGHTDTQFHRDFRDSQGFHQNYHYGHENYGYSDYHVNTHEDHHGY